VRALSAAQCRAYSIHGVTVEVVADDPAVGAQLEMRLRGFAGEPDPAEPMLRLEFVRSLAAAPPPGPGRPVYETPHGPLHYFAHDDVLAGELGGVALRCEPGLDRAVIAAPAFRGPALYLATHPLATIALMELMERHGRFALHAGCLAAANGDGVLLAGPSGAGKSTLTLALARAGMRFLGDDVVFIERPAHGPGARLRALGFADTIGLGTFAAARFPELAAAAAEPPADGFPKRLHRFEELFAGQPIAGCEPRVLIFAEVAADRASSISPLDGGEALLRLVPDVLATHPESTRAHIAAIAALLEQVRCYAVRSGSDLERAADLVHALV
jgi:hypothetical protein